MKISFFSNYLTHHQIPFCLEMQKREDVEFYFISTEPMEKEREQGGWAFTEEYPFEIKAYASQDAKEQALKLAVESDVVMIGSAPEEYREDDTSPETLEQLRLINEALEKVEALEKKYAAYILNPGL